MTSTTSTARIDLRATPAAASRARDWLSSLDPPVGGERAQVVVSELVTNSVRHAGMAPDRGWITLRACVDDGRCRLEVADEGPGFTPSHGPGMPPSGQPDGRGLFIVDRYSESWGVVRNGRTTVWAAVPVEAERGERAG